jgi:hypothetical protein
MISARVSMLFVAAMLLGGATAEGACPAGQTRDCVINLEAVPQISQQVVAQDRIAPIGKTAPGTDPQTPYSGPTVGLTPTPRKFPTFGYRWSFD